MDYWESVLHEVVNRNKEGTEFRFTNLDEYRDRVKRTRWKGPSKEPAFEPLYLRESAGVYLTPREAETLAYLMDCDDLNQIAVYMKLSRRTIDYYLKILRTKLEAFSRMQIRAKVEELGLDQRLPEVSFDLDEIE